MHRRAHQGPCFAEVAAAGGREGVHQGEDGGTASAAGDYVWDEHGAVCGACEGVGEEEGVGEVVAEGVGVEDDCGFYGVVGGGGGDVGIVAVELLRGAGWGAG